MSPQTPSKSFSPLFTDLYQLSMARAYFESKHASERATFELFFRKCPFQGEYAIASGHHLVRRVLENFRFTKDDIGFLQTLPQFQAASQNFFEALLQLNLDDIEVRAVREGEVVFGRVPLFQVEGPIFKVQLLETALLNAVNFSTLIATYARRIRRVVPTKHLMEFGMRRAQGPNGAETASRSSYLGGFDSTSNVAAAREFHIPAAGTMAHSFVQSFSELYDDDLTWPNGRSIKSLLTEAIESDGALATNEGELAAFLAYAKVFPGNCSLLVDTYDVLKSGIPNAIRVFRILKALGYSPAGIRLDSGDLVYLSKQARQMLSAAGFHDVSIVASNELNEPIIASLLDQGAEIDSFGVGTHLVVATEQPALGGVYKLVEVGKKPRIKISEQTEKLVLPCAKNIYRLYGKDGLMLLDLMTLANEPAPIAGRSLEALHPTDFFKRVTVVPSKVEPLLSTAFKNGKWLAEDSLERNRAFSLARMTQVRDDILRRTNPTPYKVSISLELQKLLKDLIQAERPSVQLS